MITQLAVADDHPVVLDGIRLMLDSIGGYALAGVAASLKELMSVCAEVQPDVLILDLNIDGQNSLDLVPELHQRHPNLKILIFSAYQSTGLVKKALDTGVNGYLLKDASKTEWVEALATVSQGNIYLSKHLKSPQAARFEEMVDVVGFSQIVGLSDQEKKVIRLTAQGLAEQAIAETLYISKHTVHTHKKNIFRKLSLHTNADLVKFAYENSLV